MNILWGYAIFYIGVCMLRVFSGYEDNDTVNISCMAAIFLYGWCAIIKCST